MAKPMISFPSKDELPDGQPSRVLSLMVAIARTHWRMAHNEGWPERVCNAHQTVHDDIAERVQRGLRDIQAKKNVHWPTIANELANEMTSYAIRLVYHDATMGAAEVYMGANIALAAVGMALLDWAR